MEESLNSVVPKDENEPYDMHEVIDAIVDHGSLLEVHPYYARNAVVGFARLDGYSVGIVANQPAHLAGVLDIDSSDKIARFVRHVRRLQHSFSSPSLTPQATCPGWIRSITDHPPRRQGDLRLLRGDGAKDLARHEKGHRRRLHCHELPADAL